MTTDIINTCSSKGYPLLPAYANDTSDSRSCYACHSSPNRSEERDAYNAGNYEYFCPAPAPEPEPQTCTDADEDGYFAEGENCGTEADFNDSDASAYPGATEDCTDGVDNDGNGLTDAADPNAANCPAECTDMDVDGYSIEGGSCGAIDCDNNDASINPGAAEICTDKIDNNCNGLTDTADMNAVDCPIECTDADGDGYSIEGGSCGAMDCDDTNADVNPGALEVCEDGVDNNCNALVDDTDSVCQSDDDEAEVPWWRKHHRHHHHNRYCNHRGNGDSVEDESEVDESDEDDRGSRYPHRDRSNRLGW